MDSTLSTPPPETPQRTKWISWKWTFIVSAIAITFLMWQCGSALFQSRKLVGTAVRQFHAQLNAGQYDAICQEADEGFRRAQSYDETIKFLQGVHNKLGNAGAESLTNLNVSATTGGTFVTTQYKTTFARGTAQETFTWIKHGAALKLRRYDISSTAFLLN